jgi:hypothetical protein
VEHVEAMLSVKGVDLVQFGPADYSMSIGIPGQHGGGNRHRAGGGSPLEITMTRFIRRSR